MREPVKGRTEAGRRREQRARDTREQIMAAALRLFVEQGYVATTVVAIAQAAGVAPATIYQAFGTKQAILAGALDRAIAGDAEPVELLAREWVTEATSQADARSRLAEVVSHTARVAARTAPLKVVMRDAAAADPIVGQLIREDHERRRRTQRALVEKALDRDGLRPGLSVEQAADTFFLLVNSSNYDLATQVLGWSDARWQEWLVDLLTHELLDG